MRADIKRALILEMARAMCSHYFSPTRPYEKQLITLAGRALSALERSPQGRVVIERAAKQLNLMDYEDQPLLPLDL